MVTRAFRILGTLLTSLRLRSTNRNRELGPRCGLRVLSLRTYHAE